MPESIFLAGLEKFYLGPFSLIPAAVAQLVHQAEQRCALLLYPDPPQPVEKGRALTG